MRIRPLIASEFASDGGTMFGLVPKPIWNKRMPADERNRIPQHAHALLIELPDGRRGLVDTGCGSAANFLDKECALHGLGPGWPLREALAAAGVALEDIDFVAFTHLHWDHAGSLVAPPDLGRALTFPRARYYVHEQEWRDALSGDELLYKSYPETIVAALRGLPVDRVDRLSDERAEIAPGLRLLRSGGHTRGHSVLVADQPEIVTPGATVRPPFAVFAGDVCPTRHHLRMVFQTSYDTYPLETRAWKRKWLPRLAQERGALLLDHDPDVFGVFIRADEREEFAVDGELACAARTA